MTSGSTETVLNRDCSPVDRFEKELPPSYLNLKRQAYPDILRFVYLMYIADCPTNSLESPV
jgi:hypothetical protein